jgi:hypothetical protein
MRQLKASLDLIEIASPCPASWDEMVGDERVRFCRQCGLNVYNVSDMGRDEAEMFIHECTAGQASSGTHSQVGSATQARTCVRLFRREDGTVITKDCPVGIRALRQRFVRAIAAIAGLLMAMISGTLFGGALTRRLPGLIDTPAEALARWIDPTPRNLVMGVLSCPPNPPPTKVMIDLTPAETPLLPPTPEQMQQIQQRLKQTQ